MWREEGDGWTAGQKICPIMSEPRGMVLCQGKHCAAAYTRNLGGETCWFCEIIEGYRHEEGCWGDQHVPFGGEVL